VICGCQRIKEISFPDSVENAAQITACYGLERIRYSRKVRELPYNSVISCPKLKRIELADETEIGLRAIVDCENAEIVRYS